MNSILYAIWYSQQIYEPTELSISAYLQLDSVIKFMQNHQYDCKKDIKHLAVGIPEFTTNYPCLSVAPLNLITALETQLV